jgi:hypothetical protein
LEEGSTEIQVSEIDVLHDKCRAERVSIFLGPEEKLYRRGDMHLRCRQFLVQDPDGYLLRFQQTLGTMPAGS